MGNSQSDVEIPVSGTIYDIQMCATLGLNFTLILRRLLSLVSPLSVNAYCILCIIVVFILCTI